MSLFCYLLYIIQERKYLEYVIILFDFHLIIYGYCMLFSKMLLSMHLLTYPRETYHTRPLYCNFESRLSSPSWPYVCPPHTSYAPKTPVCKIRLPVHHVLMIRPLLESYKTPGFFPFTPTFTLLVFLYYGLFTSPRTHKSQSLRVFYLSVRGGCVCGLSQIYTRRIINFLKVTSSLD